MKKTDASGQPRAAMVSWAMGIPISLGAAEAASMKSAKRPDKAQPRRVRVVSDMRGLGSEDQVGGRARGAWSPRR
jgi:hypothetical protein